MNFYILVPVFNEDKTISSVVNSLVKEYPECTVIVVDDGSSDNTKFLLEKINYNNLLKLRLPKNSGKELQSEQGLIKFKKSKMKTQRTQ